MGSKTIAITGSGGFLGHALYDAFCSVDDVAIIAMTSHPERFTSAESSSRCKIVDSSPESLFAIGDSIDVLVDCAFPRAGSGVSMAEGLDYQVRLFHACNQAHVGAVVHVSSQSVYDPQRNKPATENDPLCLLGDYAVAKRSVELLADAILEEIPHTHIRLGSLIGPGFNQRVINKMINRSLHAEKITISGDAKFDFLDIDDAARALRLLVFSDPFTWHNVFNLGSGNVFSLSEIASTCVRVVSALTGIEGVIEKTEEEAKSFSSALDSSLFETSFHYQPERTLYESAMKIAKSMYCSDQGGL